MKPEDVNLDRLYLILGICMESLCSPTSRLSDDTVEMCLKALHALLDSKWPRRQLGDDPLLAKELLNVMHRTILTRDRVVIHAQAIAVVSQVVKGSQESLEAEKVRLKEKELNTPSTESVESMDTTDSACSVGEGGERGDIVPGQSVVFATLEACLCALVKHIPAISPAAAATGFQTPTHLTLAKMSDDAFALIASTVSLMADLPSLCSPAGAVSILPTVLYLVTRVMRELLTESGTGGAGPGQGGAACLQALKALCTHALLEEEAVHQQWLHMLQSALATVLNNAQDVPEKASMDPKTLLLTLAIFTVSCPRDVTAVPNLLQPTLDIYRKAWDAGNPEVRLVCVQTFTSLLGLSDRQVATPYIHALAPRMVEFLNQAAASRPSTEAELTLRLEVLRMMELLVTIAEPDKRVTLAALLVPALVACLLDERRLEAADSLTRRLHETALTRITQLGRSFPEQFRAVMGMSADLKPRVEAAVKANQALALRSKNAAPAKAASVPARPTITLKTDFNFSG